MKYIVFLFVIFSYSFSYERIVALSPSINEIIYALDAQNKIIGNTTYSRFPKESNSKQKVGGYFSPSLEKIIALNPDLVIMQKHYKFMKKLNKLGIKTKVVQINNLENIKKSILDIGTITSKKDKALNIVKEINLKIKQIQNIVKDKKILFVIGHNTSLVKRIFVSGSNLYFESIINVSGNQNAYQSTVKGQPVLNYENIIALNADIVILLSPYIKENNLTKKELLEPWKDIPIKASKNNNIYFIDAKYAGMPSDRIIYFLDDFKNILQRYKKNDTSK
ncbi:MAG TPA: iron ABC transporter substrate-binding protein [Arcobacter sp.]|nr:iron ABC transporter substrate-binding protein [Arcobacter sp.]HIP56161.1 iron ABC transporter substrate-binding protein [Arcobacter sp.]